MWSVGEEALVQAFSVARVVLQTKMVCTRSVANHDFPTDYRREPG